MNKSKICIPFSAALREGDTETQTIGCRQKDPEICKYNSLEGICAFSRDDEICKHPSKAWKKQYQKLSENIKVREVINCREKMGV